MKITEIVLGKSTLSIMNQSNKLSNNKKIKFDTIFSVVDLSVVDNYKIILPEKIFYKKIEYSFKNELADLDEAINNGDKIRIWSSHLEIESYLLFLYLCNYVVNKNCNLFVVFSSDYKEECYSTSCMTNNELDKLTKLEHKLTKEEIIKYANDWKKVRTTNSDMRIIENKEVKSVSFDYFDEIILNKLKEMGEIEEVKLVILLMIEYNLSDSTFIYLINRLIKKEKIEVVYHDLEESELHNIIKLK